MFGKYRIKILLFRQLSLGNRERRNLKYPIKSPENKWYNRLKEYIDIHMKNIGAALIAFTGAFITLGMFSYYTWGIYYIAIPFFILGTLSFGFGITFATIGLIRDERDANLIILRRHFDDMQKEAFAMPILDQNDGDLYLHIAKTRINIDQPLKMPLEFGVHFPQEYNALNIYSKNVISHNIKYQEFIEKIKLVFKSYHFELIGSSDQLQSPYIYSQILTPLLQWWHCRHNGLPCYIDFKKIDYIEPNNLNLYIDGLKTQAVAYAENETDKNYCIEVINCIAFNADYEKEAGNIINSSKTLITSVSDLKNQLVDTIEKIDKNWPALGKNWSTKEYRFNRLDNKCSKCRLLPK